MMGTKQQFSKIPQLTICGVCSKKFEPISPKTDKTRGAGGIPPPDPPSARPAEGDLFGLDDFKFFAGGSPQGKS